MKKKTKYGALLKFANKATVYKREDCLLWPYCKTTGGYGTISISNKTILVHRYVCKSAHGEPPTPKHEAAHSCGVRHCINPLHLRWATRTENQADRNIHDTSNRGERHPKNKLTEDQVLVIRADNRAYSVIAEKYGISRSSVCVIKSRKNWGWLK